MRILIHSAGPDAPTGYGQITRAIASRLVDRGHDVWAFGYVGHLGLPKWNGKYWILGRSAQSEVGHDMIKPYADYYNVDVVLSICDPWIVPPKFWQAVGRRVIFWCPIQTDMMHDYHREVLDCADAVWCYSEFGTDVLHRRGFPEALHMPLGYEPGLYDVANREKHRAYIRGNTKGGDPLANEFVIGMIAANSSTIPGPRKGLTSALRVFGALDAMHPDSFLMFLGTRVDGTRNGGVDLQAAIDHMGLSGRVLVMDAIAQNGGIPDSEMAKLYASFDVLLAPSMAEGFCLPLLEAQMAGTPVVTVDFSSMSELVGYGVATAPLKLDWSPDIAGGDVAICNDDALVAAIANIREHGAPCNEAVMEKLRGWTWDAIAERVHAGLVGEGVTA